MSAERIRQLAVEIGRQNKVALLASWGICRTNNSDNLPQLYMIVGAMGGHMGKSGHMTAVASHTSAWQPWPESGAGGWQWAAGY